MPTETHLNRVKAATVELETRKEKARALKQVALTQLRQAGLFRLAAQIEQCGSRERPRRCGCGADLGVINESCHQYFCYRCQRSKAYKIAKEVEELLQELQKTNPGLKVLWGTFTLPACAADELKTQLDTLMRGFAKMLQKPALKKYLIAAFRSIEFGNKGERGTFHAHLHALIVVKASYFSKGYLSQQDWLSLWQEASNCKQATQISLQRLQADATRGWSLKKTAGGKADYMLKPLQPAEWSPKDLAVIRKAIRKRHLCEFLGGFRQLRKQLNQQKPPPCICPNCLSLQPTPEAQPVVVVNDPCEKDTASQRRGGRNGKQKRKTVTQDAARLCLPAVETVRENQLPLRQWQFAWPILLSVWLAKRAAVQTVRAPDRR